MIFQRFLVGETDLSGRGGENLYIAGKQVNGISSFASAATGTHLTFAGIFFYNLPVYYFFFDLRFLLRCSQVTSGKPQHQTVTDSAYARPTKATTQQSAAPAPPKQNLDSMLGNLQADMSRQGVNTSQKGCCSACEKPIVGQVITALGKTWHPEHFTCAHCTQELGTRNFFERDGKPYCEPDYHNLFSPRCAYCNGPILDVRQALILFS